MFFRLLERHLEKQYELPEKISLPEQEQLQRGAEIGRDDIFLLSHSELSYMVKAHDAKKRDAGDKLQKIMQAGGGTMCPAVCEMYVEGYCLISIVTALQLSLKGQKISFFGQS